MNVRLKPLLVSTLLLLLMICFELGVQSFGKKEYYSVAVHSGDTVLTGSKGLNQLEQAVITMLTNTIRIKIDSGMEESEYNGYIRYLQKYLNSPGVNLKEEDAYEALGRILELKEIMNLEKETDINKMSVDAKELAVNLSQKIYKACGLKLTYDMQGNIAAIVNGKGKYLYLNESLIQKSGYQWELLIIIITVVLILLSNCFFIARKNQLYIKDVLYDGFKEKGFVQ